MEQIQNTDLQNSINDLWVMKYRPQTLDELCLPQRLKQRFSSGIVDTHLLFGGSPGTGKTSLARILASKHTTKYFNGSDERRIDVIRKQVIDFCATNSILNTGIDKVVFFEEAEKLTKDAQDALKAVIEKYEKHVKFLFTSNHPERLDDALLSRFEYINFNSFTNDEMIDMKKQCGKRLYDILVNEHKQIDPPALMWLLDNVFPDMRKMTGLLYAASKHSDKIELQHLTKELIGEHSELFDIVLSTKQPEKIYAEIKGKYSGKELDALKALGEPFLEHLYKNDLYKDKILQIAAITHKYTYEATTGDVDLLLPLLAACNAISQLTR